MATTTTTTHSLSKVFAQTSMVNVRYLPLMGSSFDSKTTSKFSGLGINCSSQQVVTPPCDDQITRRSGNYPPSRWGYDFIQSLNTTKYSDEINRKRASELKEQLVKMMLEDNRTAITQLEFIDDLQKLGISYHFEDIIEKILTRVYQERYNLKTNGTITGSSLEKRDLYTEALEFRLFRQHGFEVSQGVFDGFKNDKGEFESSLSKDIKALIQLYEASHLSTEGESTLEQAREFSTTFLQKYLDDDVINDENIALLARSALELSLHWTIQRPNARLFIDSYEMRKKKDMNPILLEFAKLDFNMLQETHQDEIKQVSRWWKESNLAKSMPFARDNIVECYSWTGCSLIEPQYAYARIMTTKAFALISITDDIYDVYGTLEELQILTDAMERWDMEKLDELPEYMRLCFLAVNNFINEIAYDVLNDQGFNAIPYLRKMWKDLCRAFFQESKWYYQGYTPTVEEYINHSWVSVSIPAILLHVFFMVANPIEKDVVESMFKYHNLMKWSGLTFRLVNDLATSQDETERGDVPKMIQCYMNESGGSEREGQEFTRNLIRETWKKMNGEIQVGKPPFPTGFIKCAANFDRMAHLIYQHGDGHGGKDSGVKKRLASVLFEPIP